MRFGMMAAVGMLAAATAGMAHGERDSGKSKNRGLSPNIARILVDDDLIVLKTYDKAEAVSRLHLSLGARMRDALGLWNEDALIRLDAIYEYANQGMLMGYDADGGSTALLEYLWERIKE